RVSPRRPERLLQLDARGDERLGQEATPELAEAAFGGGLGHEVGGRHRSRSSCQSKGPSRGLSWRGVAAARAVATNARSLRGSLCPGSDSTPVATSTPQGWTAAMA